MMHEIGDYEIDGNVAMDLLYDCTGSLVKLEIPMDTNASHYKKLTISLQDGFDYEEFRKQFMCTEDCINNRVVMHADYLFNRKAFLANAKIIKEQIKQEVLKEQNQQEVEQRAGFDTGDGLAQNIQANPVSDNKPKESATGLTFDTVPAPIKINKFGIWCEEIDTFLTDVESLHERKDGRVWLFAGKETSQNPFTEVIKAVYLGEDKDVDVGWQNDKDKVQENISRLRERNNAQEIGDIIFWHLLALAVDDDLWRNNIANVTDWAYCLGFDTQMLQDWCQMVKYVLEGNKLGAYCRYVVKTEQGKKYFHIDCAA